MNKEDQFKQIVYQWMDIVTHHSMGGMMRYVRSNGLSMPQFFTMMQVHHRGHCGMSDLSEHMDVTIAATSQLVEKLVQNGLLTRTEDPDDRRAKFVALSPKGKEIIEKGFNERHQWVDEWENSLTADEKMKIADAFDRMIRATTKLETQNNFRND